MAITDSTGLDALGSGAAGVSEEPASFGRKLLRSSGWIFLFLFFLVFFSIAKLPDDRIRGYVLQEIDGFLGPHGMSMTAESSHLSLIFGPSYKFEGVKLNLPEGQPPVKFDKITVSPAILPLLLGKIGGSIDVKQGDGSIDASFTSNIPKGNASPSAVDLSAKARKLNLDKASFLMLYIDLGAANGVIGPDLLRELTEKIRSSGAALQGTSILNLDFSQSGDPANPSSLALSLLADLSKISIEPQTLMGFAIPHIGISEIHADIRTEKSRLVIKSLRIGKNGASDDIHGSVTGDIALGKTWDSSNANLKVNFTLSDAILSGPLSLLKMLLQPAEQSDKSYSYAISGPIANLNAQPVPK